MFGVLDMTFPFGFLGYDGISRHSSGGRVILGLGHFDHTDEIVHLALEVFFRPLCGTAVRIALLAVSGIKLLLRQALRLAKRLEIHHTPKQITALDITEIELSALGNQCLSMRHISNVKELMRSYQLGTPILMPRREVSIGSSRQPRHESS